MQEKVQEKVQETMKQYTTPEQTAKLIELGFEKPKSVTSISWDAPKNFGIMINANSIKFDYHYSIGELIEMLNGESELEITRYGSGWGVYDELRAFTSEELIDALYDTVIRLKEEGVV